MDTALYTWRVQTELLDEKLFRFSVMLVDVLHKANDGNDAMTVALCQSGAMAESLSKFLPLNYKLEGRFISESDPIGSMIVSAKFGKTATCRDFLFISQETLYLKLAGLC